MNQAQQQGSQSGGNFSREAFSHKQIERIFNRCFEDIQTVLIGGAAEPLYLPHDKGDGIARIFYRLDYASSALHEISHWCIAGSERLKQIDFGYWYAPDGRTPEQQREFYGLEVKPQALESIFSEAAGIKFNLSADNLAGDVDSNELERFGELVAKQRRIYLLSKMPPRALRFLDALLNGGHT
jgi:elongation factor P hydroxylase